MKIIKLIIVSLSLLSLSFSENRNMDHPFYLSLTEIHFIPEESIMQVSVRVFADDFEEALKKLSHFEGTIDTRKMNPNFYPLFGQYVNKRLAVEVNNKYIPLTCIGYEFEDNAIWIYFESPLPESPKFVDINNSILYDFIPQQSNMMHCILGKERKSTKLNYPDRKFSFSY